MNRESLQSRELAALAALARSFNWTLSREDVWKPSPYHVPELHPGPTAGVRQGIDAVAAADTGNPLGIVLLGQRGVGKTHLLAWAREQICAEEGYFFLVGDLSSKTFWEETRDAILDQLLKPEDGTTQLMALLSDLARKAGLSGQARDAVSGKAPLVRKDLDAFAVGLRQADQSVLPPRQDFARALALLASPQQEQMAIGDAFLRGDEVTLEDRRAWGIHSSRREIKFLLQELSRLIALSGPTIIAVDQIDALVHKTVRAAEQQPAPSDHRVADVAEDLMSLRDLTRRTLTIIACLGESWDYLQESAVGTVVDRFYPPLQLSTVSSPRAGQVLIAGRFAPGFEQTGFTAPYPTWPIRAEAFHDATSYTARQLLQRAEAHVSECLRNQAVRELDRLSDEPTLPSLIPAPRPGLESEEILSRLDQTFAEFRDDADIVAALDPAQEDMRMPALLEAGLSAWILERDEARRLGFSTERRPDNALHACLQLTSDDSLERRWRWSFRTVGAVNAIAVQSRMKKAISASGLNGDEERRLFLIRNTPWPNGAKTEELRARFEDLGGMQVAVTADDLRTFTALSRMDETAPTGFGTWLAARQPAHQSELLSKTLGAISPDENGGAAPGAPAADSMPARSEPAGDSDPGPPADDPGGILIGSTFRRRKPVSLSLASLCKHAAIFAGSGAGKTVLLRRIIEECALNGVSSIVLDPNNDLARLGDPWPGAAEGWLDGDAERAARFLATTDVVIWTPRRRGGRPLSFRPLPSFADVCDNPDEFDAAVDAAVEAIAPRINVHKETDKARMERAVLTEGLRYFGIEGGSDLGDFVALLAELPPDASRLAKATSIAADLADRLDAARVIDPQFGGAGEAADPGMLLTPSPGMRARISVISMVGVPEEQRPAFINQLQLALFAWVKKHPADDRPLAGLLVMDEAQTLAPPGLATASTRSTLMLASQARKYGLGLLFATQSPHGVHNEISNNAATQFYGRVGSTAQIDAVRTIARAKGGDMSDVGRLGKGEFYLSAEGRSPQKITIPMCLSCHPANPLTEEEIILRTRRA